LKPMESAKEDLQDIWESIKHPWASTVDPNFYDKLHGRDKPGDDTLKDAVKDNTDELRRNTDAQRGASTGRFGGGPRGGRAVPPGWEGQVLDSALIGGAIRRGSSTLRP